MIAPSTIDKVKELSVVDVISHYVDLKKSGSAYKALSPFSNEKSPSFYVVPSKNIFKCFSSGKGGDAITFVMEKQGLSYPDAIQDIAGKCGIAVEYEDNGQPKEYYDQIEMLYKINRATAKRYSEALLCVQGQPGNSTKGEYAKQHDAIADLIDKRRFTADTIIQWQIGYAPGDVVEYRPDRWRFLSEVIIQKGYYEQAIELGLIKTKGSVNYDALRHRVIYPIIDHHGRYAGFGARALRPDEYNAKYMNSPESRIFNKGKLLFGLHFASDSIRKIGYAHLVEGYTDVISLHQAGLNNTVGTCGTALTEEQCKLLRKYTNKVVLLGDGDEAGQNAVLRAIDELMKFGFQTTVVPMPQVEGKSKVDPDELVRMF